MRETNARSYCVSDLMAKWPSADECHALIKLSLTCCRYPTNASFRRLSASTSRWRGMQQLIDEISRLNSCRRFEPPSTACCKSSGSCCSLSSGASSPSEDRARFPLVIVPDLTLRPGRVERAEVSSGRGPLSKRKCMVLPRPGEGARAATATLLECTLGVDNEGKAVFLSSCNCLC